MVLSEGDVRMNLFDEIAVHGEVYKRAYDEALRYRQEFEELLFEASRQGITLYGVQQRTGINEATLRGMVKRVEKKRAEALDAIMADGVQKLKMILHLPGGYVFQDASIINEHGEVTYHFIITKRENPLLKPPSRFQYTFTTEHEWDWHIFDELFGTRLAWHTPLEEIRHQRKTLNLTEEEINTEIN